VDGANFLRGLSLPGTDINDRNQSMDLILCSFTKWLLAEGSHYFGFSQGKR